MNDLIPYLNPERIHFLETVDSTNTYCKQEFIKNGDIVVSNQQTAGRGRGAKSWISPGIGNIFFSGKLVIESLVSQFSLISLFVGGSVLKTLQQFSNTPNLLTIKWPNDIYLEDKKISGILIEGSTIGETTTLIIGIGVNLFWEFIPEELSAAALFPFKITLENRDRIILQLIKEINNGLKNFYTNRIEDEVSWIWKNSYLQKKLVKTIIDSKLVEGNVIGLDSNGFLLVESKGSIVTLIDTGENFQILEME